ncbi:UNVERIFIED_CONTAM: aminoacetone oxidase family FAD-binding enzyme, partial [Bacillus subtilis]
LFIKQTTIQGLSLRDVAVSVLNKKDSPSIPHIMAILNTHCGLSRPAILSFSQFVVKELKQQHQVPITIDLYPDNNEETLFK